MSQNSRFLIRFFVILVVSYAAIAWAPINDNVVVPFTTVVARTSGAILRGIGEEVQVNGTTIASAQFAVDVNNGCNGVEAMILLVAAISAFPATATARIAGVVGGSIFVQLLNLIRVVSLYLLGRYQPKLFDLFHTGVWQIAIIIATLIVFLFWSRKFALPKPAETNP